MLRRQATTGRLILVVVPQQNTLNADNSVPTHTHTHTPATQSLCLVCLDVTTMFFGRPFVKRFALRYRTVGMSVLSVCLSVGDVGAL